MLRYVLLPIAFLAFLGAAWPQNIDLGDRPKVVQPKKPATRQEMEKRDALQKYVEGLRLERDDKILEALKAFQESVELDPNEPAPLKRNCRSCSASTASPIAWRFARRSLRSIRAIMEPGTRNRKCSRRWRNTPKRSRLSKQG